MVNGKFATKVVKCMARSFINQRSNYKKLPKQSSCKIDCGTVVALGSDVGNTSLIRQFLNTQHFAPNENDTIHHVTAFADRNNGRIQNINFSENNSEYPSQIQIDLKLQQSVDDKICSPMSYRATMSNATGFVLACSFNKSEIINLVMSSLRDIKQLRQDENTPVFLVFNENDTLAHTDKKNEIIATAKNLHINYQVVTRGEKLEFRELASTVLNEMVYYVECKEKDLYQPNELAFLPSKMPSTVY